MAPGWISKLVNFAKKVGSGISKVAKKIWNFSKPAIEVATPILQAAPHPAAKGIGAGLQFATPYVNRLLGSR